MVVFHISEYLNLLPSRLCLLRRDIWWSLLLTKNSGQDATDAELRLSNPKNAETWECENQKMKWAEFYIGPRLILEQWVTHKEIKNSETKTQNQRKSRNTQASPATPRAPLPLHLPSSSLALFLRLVRTSHRSSLHIFLYSITIFEDIARESRLLMSDWLMSKMI